MAKKKPARSRSNVRRTSRKKKLKTLDLSGVQFEMTVVIRNGVHTERHHIDTDGNDAAASRDMLHSVLDSLIDNLSVPAILRKAATVVTIPKNWNAFIAPADAKPT